MALWHEIVRRTTYLVRRSRFDDELQGEIQFHIDMRADDLERTGVPRREALAQARREFGSRARVAEDTRSAWQFRWLEDLSADLRYGLRAFRRNPGFALTATLSLALGIGANSAVFTALDAVLWKPLPVADPETLVRFSITTESLKATSDLPIGFVRQLRESGVFSDLITQASDGLSFTYDDRAERIIGEVVTPNFFPFLGVQPILGRGFSADVQSGRWAAETVLSYRFWQRRFAADPGVIGRTIHLNTYPFMIVGVSPPSFLDLAQGFEPELRLPVLPDGGELSQMHLITGSSVRSMTTMARLGPDATIASIEAAVDARFQEFLRTSSPEISRSGRRHVRVLPGARGWTDDLDPFRAPLFVLLALVAIVLLISCANGASMLLARATARRRELAVRASIGAGRLRLVRQMLAESLLLASAGGALAMPIARWTAQLLPRFLPQGHVSLVIDLHPDRRVLLFTTALSLVSGLLFGMAPALQATRGDLAGALKGDSAAAVGEPRGAALRKVLVAGQVAFSLVLLIVAALFVRTLSNLQPADFSGRTDHVLLFTMKPQLEIYPADRIRQMAAELLRRVAAIPGVRASALAEAGPLASRHATDPVHVPGHDQPIVASSDDVTPGFFDAIGVRLVAGRDFRTSDTPASSKVAIINLTLARALFKDEDAIGHIIELPPARGRLRRYEVIGVAADFRYHDLHLPPPPTVWLGFQDYPPYMPTLHVRTAGADAAATLSAVRREFDAVDKGFPVFNIKSLDLRVEDALARERLVADLSAAFGLLAVLLAAIGLYGVLTYSVTRRTREIGVRMALGSSTGSVLWLVAREALHLVAAGIVAGVSIAAGAGRLLIPYLYGVSATDPMAFLASAAILLSIAGLAVSLPAYRASRVDPLLALRHD